MPGFAPPEKRSRTPSQQDPVFTPGPAASRARATHAAAVEPASVRRQSAERSAEAALATNGDALPTAIIRPMEQRFARDFTNVRVHAGDEAANAAEALGATAFTRGEHIGFARSSPAPMTEAGHRLLAHELTHVVQHRLAGPSRVPSGISRSDDPAEQEAERVASGAAADVRTRPRAAIACQTVAPPAGAPVVPSTPPVFNVFEEPSAATPAGAKVALDKYLLLDASDQRTARRWSLGTGALQKVLAALGPAEAANPKYATVVHDILRWIEETETRKTTGKTDAEIAKTQAGFIKTQAASPPGWGGTSTTRWAGLLPAAQASWTKRGTKAIDDMVAHATSAAPELKLAKSSFELAFDAIDKTSLGALATVGSQPGKTVMVGFEFVATVEVNPAYALSTVVHELLGHPVYDEASGAPNYAGKLYKAAAAQVPASKTIDRSGDESFNYWPSEIYSLLKELPYWTAVGAADAKKKITLPGGTTNAAKLNFDPRGAIRDWVRSIQSEWEPSLVNGIVRGFYRRIAHDPSIRKTSVTEFEAIIKKEFSATDAAIILK